MAAAPYSMPTRAGPTPSVLRCSDSTGSSIEIVPEMATTVSAHAAIAGTRSTMPIGTASRGGVVRRQPDPGEQTNVDDRHHRDGEERQADAADLVEPAAERRPEHDREARARHHDAGDAAALVGP